MAQSAPARPAVVSTVTPGAVVGAEFGNAVGMELAAFGAAESAAA